MKEKTMAVRIMAKFTAIRAGLIIVALLIGGGANAAEPIDLKIFNVEERYSSGETTIVLTQKIGEAAVKLKSPPKIQTESALSTSTGAKFELNRPLRKNFSVYKLQTGGVPSVAENRAALDSLSQDRNVAYAYPVYASAENGGRVFLMDEVIVQLKPSVRLYATDILKSLKLKFADQLPGATNRYVLRLSDPRDANPFRICDALRQRPEVLWAEPNKMQEAQSFAIPNDTLFSSQWHLRNTGQTGAFSDADVDADDAWDGSQGYGSPGIRIAILDDGVQTTHPDLAANIVQGYDFFDGDADANPGHANDNHGTSVAGTSAAVANNSTGVAGVAGKCQILPIRVEENGVFTDDAKLYRAIVYAADNADVLNCSWGAPVSGGTLDSAFQYASSGRGGFGCAVMCASGNSAGGDGANSYETLQPWTLYPTLPAGNYYFGFVYSKDANGSDADDCFWLADVIFPYGARERFDSSSLPQNWVTLGNANWSGSVDAAHSHGTTAYAWRSGVIGNSQQSLLISPLATLDATHPTLWFRTWISSQNLDQAKLLVFNQQQQQVASGLIGQGTVANRYTPVAYPANHSTTFAVGASSDFDYRSHFSQYGSALTFVAPGGGGYGGIATTDRTGSDGYVSGDYVAQQGTSFSAPIAAGIAALVLSKDGNQSASTVATKLNATCDKIGPVTYSGSPYTRNDNYGYGRLNANAAVDATTADTTSPTYTSATVIHHRAVNVVFSEPMGEGVFNPNNYSITAGQGTLSSSPNKVIRIWVSALGGVGHTPSSVYRLIWNSGSMAESGTVTIQASSSIKDVAGNSLSGTLSRSSTGTKRVLAVNCGSGDVSPFLSDEGFQGNEAAPFLTTDTEGFYDDEELIWGADPYFVYCSQRRSWSDVPGNYIEYSLPDMPVGNLKVILHFAELNEDHQAGDQVFDIYINGTLKSSFFDIVASVDAPNIACPLEYSNITRDGNNKITVKLDPQEGSSGGYRAAINGIEIVKP